VSSAKRQLYDSHFGQLLYSVARKLLLITAPAEGRRLSGLCVVQHHVLSCLADVVEYFVAKVGASARPLQVDPATLCQLEALSPPSAAARRSSIASATVSPRSAPVAALQHPTAAAGPGVMPSSVAFNQFVYSNNAVPPTAPGLLRYCVQFIRTLIV